MTLVMMACCISVFHMSKSSYIRSETGSCTSRASKQMLIIGAADDDKLMTACCEEYVMLYQIRRISKRFPLCNPLVPLGSSQFYCFYCYLNIDKKYCDMR